MNIGWQNIVLIFYNKYLKIENPNSFLIINYCNKYKQKNILNYVKCLCFSNTCIDSKILLTILVLLKVIFKIKITQILFQ